MPVTSLPASLRIACSLFVVLAAGCGGSGAAAVDAGAGDATAPADGGGSGGDSGSVDSGSDAGVVDSGGTVDASSPVDAGPQCFAPGATMNSCRTCCSNAYPMGSQIFDGFTVECACAPSLCGTLDAGTSGQAEGGAGDGGADEAGSADGAGADAGNAPGDGGLFGTGVCTATCSDKMSPDAVCNTCILSTLGSVTNLGPCGGTVLMQCLNDETCNEYFGCVENCPGSQ